MGAGLEGGLAMRKAMCVVTGLSLSDTEYAERFADLDLERYRREMAPEVFEAFVRFVGSMAGSPNLDIVKLTDGG